MCFFQRRIGHRFRFALVGIFICVATVRVCGNQAPNVELKKFSSADLIQEYEAAGLALVDTHDMPADFPISAIGVGGSPGMERFRSARQELIVRGGAVVPDLIEFLRREVTIERPKARNGVAPAFTKHVIDILVAIGDPQPADLLVEILDGFQGQANRHQRHATLSGLERLTYCSFRILDPAVENYANTVKHSTAQKDGTKFRDEEAAKAYRAWLKGEGQDARRWLDLARERARNILATEDLPAIYSVASFLQPRRNLWRQSTSNFRDDQPEKTLQRLVDLTTEVHKVGEHFEYKQQRFPMHIANWIRLITAYATRARPHSQLLIRLQEERGLDDWGGLQELRYVGGEELMAYFFRCLPRVTDNSLREVQFAIDRWAGRRFASDAERVKWWEANQGKSQEDWLREGLPIVVAQADNADPWARWIATELLPDLPWDPAMPVPLELVGERVRSVEPINRAAWLKVNQQRLQYDALLGGFRLKKD